VRCVSPLRRDRVAREDAIAAHEGEVVEERLRGEHPVERIAMDVGEGCEPERVSIVIASGWKAFASSCDTTNRSMGSGTSSLPMPALTTISSPRLMILVRSFEPKGASGFLQGLPSSSDGAQMSSHRSSGVLRGNAR
jgi:hypothetical protein